MFAKTRFRNIEILIHRFAYYWGKECCTLYIYRGPCYIEVREIEVLLYFTWACCSELRRSEKIFLTPSFCLKKLIVESLFDGSFFEGDCWLLSKAQKPDQKTQTGKSWHVYVFWLHAHSHRSRIKERKNTVLVSFNLTRKITSKTVFILHTWTTIVFSHLPQPTTAAQFF